MNAELADIVNAYPFEDSQEFVDVIAILEDGWGPRPGRRAAAAKLAWWRKKGLVRPEPWDVFQKAVKAADPRLLRLYLCDRAGAVQHVFLDAHPGETRTLAAIEAGRRLADGNLLEEERRAAVKSLGSLSTEPRTGIFWKPTPAEAALQAACFTCDKRLVHAARWSLGWAETAGGNLMGTEALTRYAALINARFARMAA